MNKKTVRDLRGRRDPRQARARARGLQRPARRARHGHRRHAHPRRAADDRATSLERGARVVLLSHLGRPKGKPEPKYSLEPVARRLGELLPDATRALRRERPTATKRSKATHALHGRRGPAAREHALPRRRGEERSSACRARSRELGDFYVNDAFGAAHRAHASTAGVARHLRPAVAGLLMEKELDYLGGALDESEAAVRRDPRRREDLRQDRRHRGSCCRRSIALLIGGAMACTFFKAMGLETGKSLVEDDRVDAGEGAPRARRATSSSLPHDALVAPSLEQAAQARRRRGATRFPRTRRCSTSGPRRAESFARAIARGEDGPLERPDGRVRDAAVRRGHARDRRGDGGGDGRGRDDDRRRRRLGRGGRARPGSRTR